MNKKIMIFFYIYIKNMNENKDLSKLQWRVKFLNNPIYSVYKQLFSSFNTLLSTITSFYTNRTILYLWIFYINIA